MNKTLLKSHALLLVCFPLCLHEEKESLKQRKSKQRGPFVVPSVAVTPVPNVVPVFILSQMPQLILYILGSNVSQGLAEIISVTEG